MKTLIHKIAVILILGSFGLTNCSNNKDQEMGPVQPLNLDTIFIEHSMKGWELYSWPNGKEWDFSFLPGTNRLKTYEEVISNKIVVCGVDSLKMLLDKFPAKEYIFWIGEGWLESIWHEGHGSISLPGSSILNEIKEYCRQKDLEITVSG
jgi:hypothetical protein